ncbi:hypothetical protein [Hydrogenimonas urashimensis]|uniref:hypothetical protein n=1 Tax=Hydrogenimonas urashimensis TaxID=2740515 RepID=UPI001915A1B4|nr:hypothetical protein [Hydrogenimonas urashimensis]
MNIKEQVEYAKEELTQDEKLLAGLIKAERFYKRNRVVILALAAIIVFGGIGYGVMGYLKEQKLLRANEAFLALQADPSDKSAMETLKKENPRLAELFALKNAVASADAEGLKRLQASKDPVVADLAAYHLGVLQKQADALKNYRMRSAALLKDYAVFDEAYLLMKKGEVKEAKERLAMIPENSPLAPVAKMLDHYGIATDKGTK